MSDIANNPGEGGEPELELAEGAEPQETEAEVEQDAEETPPPPDDTDEIEYEGVKHRIPKALKGAFLMQADYTRKTQEVAEQRRTYEEQSRTFAEQVRQQQEFIDDVATIRALDRAIEQYRQTDWNALRASQPEQAQAAYFDYQQLRDARDQAASGLQAKVTKRNEDQQRESAKQSESLRASLARDIPGYSPETASKMEAFGIANYGLTADEIKRTVDPRLHRILHDAMVGRELQAKAAKAAAAAKAAKTAEEVQPPARVGGNAQATKINPATPSGDKLTDAEWTRRRNEQLRKQRAAMNAR